MGGKGDREEGEQKEREGGREWHLSDAGTVLICFSNDGTSGPAAAIGFHHLIKFTMTHYHLLSSICLLLRPNREVEGQCGRNLKTFQNLVDKN